jgi:hypothetical protein
MKIRIHMTGLIFAVKKLTLIALSNKTSDLTQL